MKLPRSYVAALPRRRAVIACLFVVALALAGPAAASQGNMGRGQPAGAPRPVPGLRAAPPSARAVARTVEQMTGLAPSQVTADRVCPAPSGTMAQCAAQALVLRGGHARIHPRVKADATFTQVFPRHRSAGGISPAAIPAGSGGTTQAGSPAYLQQAYDLSYLSQTAGAGDTIAVVDAFNDPTAESDLATYRSFWGLPACTSASGCFRKVNQSGTASPLPGGDLGWEQEISLDLDAVSALCPNCQIILVETNTNSDADMYAGIATAQRLGANQISNSWGTTTASTAPASFSSAAVIASTGDHGWLGATTNDYPAAFPGVTAVGGTTLTGGSAASGPRGYSESAWSLTAGAGAGSGCDLTQPKPSYQTDIGCGGRSYSDVSADADPHTGLFVYDTGWGGWLTMGGTSLAAPLTAAYEAVTRVNGTTPQWAYLDSARLNDPITGSTGNCAQAILYICNAGTGYDGPTGAGSISGAVVTGAPGIGGPTGPNNGYAVTIGPQTAALTGGVYPNGLDTQYFWQYGTSTSYGLQTSTTDIGAGTTPVAAPVSLSGLAPATTYHYRLVAQNSAATTYGYDFTLTTLGAPPVNSSLPGITGAAQQGQTLSASNGTWNSAPTSYSYQWERSSDSGSTWSAISNQTNSTYIPVANDVGSELRVTVTAANAYGSASASSAGVGPITSGAPRSSGIPSISGSARRSQVLTVSSTWNPLGASYAYQWQRSSDNGASWTNIGASTASYILDRSDESALVRVTVTATNPYGQSSATSASVGPVASDPPVNTAPPSLTGTPQRTYVLGATQGSWGGVGNAYGYQWQRSSDNGATWTSIGGETGAAYTLGTADEGDIVRALVTVSNPDGVVTQASSPTPRIASYPPVSTVAPAISGVAQRGGTLSATLGTWTGPDNTYAYQWQHSADGSGWTNIPGATGPTYTATQADENTAMRIAVTATNPDGSLSAVSAPTPVITSPAGPPPVTSAPAPVVPPAAPRWTALPTLSSDPGKIGDRLKVTAGVWPDGIFLSTQVMRCTNVCVAQGLPNSGTYTITSADLGAVLRVREEATNAGGRSIVWSARAVGPIVSAQAAAAVLSDVQTPLRNSGRTTLVLAQLHNGAFIAGHGGRKPKPVRGRTVTVRRARKVAGQLIVWACVVPAGPGGGPPPCTAKVSLRSDATLRLPASASGRVRVVVVRRGH